MKVCIENTAEGFSVYEEAAGEDQSYSAGGEGNDATMAEPTGAEMGDAGPAGAESAATLEEALVIAGQMLSGDDQPSEEEAALAGYNKGPKRPMPGGMGPGKVFGEDM